MPEATLEQPAAQVAAPVSATPTLDSQTSELTDFVAQSAAPKPSKPAALAQAKVVAKTDAPKVEPAKTAAAEPAKPAAATEPAKVEVKPAEISPAKPRPWEMVRKYEKTIETLTQQIEQMKAAKTADPSTDPNAVKLLGETLAQKEKRLEELENEIKFHDYRKSSEYQDRFEKPYEQSVKRIMEESKELLHENPADGSVRALTDAEAWAVISKPSLEDAFKAAKTLFPEDPDKRQQLLAWRKEVQGLWNAKVKAEDEYRTKGKEREQQRTVEATQKKLQQEQRTAQRTQKWQQMVDQATKEDSLKEFFVAADDDAKGKEILTKGRNLVQMAFGARDESGNILGEDGKALSDEETLAIDSATFNKASAFPYVAHRNRILAKELADLKAKLAEYEKSEPGDGKPAGGAAAAAEESDEQQLTRLTREMQGR